VLDRDPAALTKGSTTAPTQFLAHVHYGHTAGWMKTPLGTEVVLGPGHIVLDRDLAAPTKGHNSPPLFVPCLLWPPSPISASGLLFIFMAALCSRCGHYIFALWFLSSSFFSSLNLSSRRLDVYHTSTQ